MTEVAEHSAADSTKDSGGSTRGTVRLMSGLRQFAMFGIVGGSGTIINLFFIYLSTKVGEQFGVGEDDILVNLFGTEYNIRWYHLFMAVAFLFANTWNYQLNRSWTFRGIPKRNWWRGFFTFLATGLVAFLVSQVIATLLMNPTSPIALPSDVFDDSTGFRTKFYWASAISILAAMPVNFIINKLWTFAKPKVAIVEIQEPV